MQYMTLTSLFIYGLLHDPKILSFICGLIAEELLIFLAFFSGHNLISFPVVFVFGFLGDLCIDSFYFLIVKSTFFKYKLFNKLESLRNKRLISRIDQAAHHNTFLTLLISKFILGVRTLVIMNFSLKDMKYGKFIRNEIFALLIWLGIMLSIGWAVGRGLLEGYALIKEIERAIAIGLIFLIALYFLSEHIIFLFLRKKKTKRKK